MIHVQDVAPPPAVSRKPRDDEIDVHGVTNRGKNRPENQDHFVIGSLAKRLNIRLSSLPELNQIPIAEERVAFFAMVADGVGGGLKGEQASRMALEIATRYINETARCYYQAAEAEADLVKALEEGARRCHRAIQAEAAADRSAAGMATTLTVFIGVWPWIYLLQIGDSRYYQYRDGVLTQISRDQTMAQELVDEGVIPQELALKSPLTHVLSSSVGGHKTEPVVTRLPNSWDNIHLLCSDGLTRHVSDERIAERLGQMQSAKQVCEDLVQDALDGGGSDNITVVVGKAIQKDSAA
ncbi:MAG TPA: protein phosphatase 2C domain-containing protein [Gemmatimonadaceae bacterium]|nr:protein phosphatase 2C domain-containing protein [Gemmatimonadaceae bacterium]